MAASLRGEAEKRNSGPRSERPWPGGPGPAEERRKEPGRTWDSTRAGCDAGRLRDSETRGQ
eukprot:3441302-Rhodomonas_salina.1